MLGVVRHAVHVSRPERPPAASRQRHCKPHSSVGHQTLFTPAYRNAQNDELTQSTAQAVNRVTYAQQRKVGGFLANYPNYITPGDSGHQVWAGHVWRLSQIKQKYDPVCLIRNGRVFASQGCTAGGWANIFSK